MELTATPAEGYEFKGWQGDITSSDNPVQVTVDQPKEVTPVFQSFFYLAENGVTVKCPEANVGDTGTVNGITYTKRTRDQITEANAENTCTSGITDMKEMFFMTRFNGDISSWDVSQVTTMYMMFFWAESFNRDLSSWDVGQVTNMQYMFVGAMFFNQDLSSWDVSSVTTMESMFEGASSFNGDLGNWDVSQVINMVRMFYGAASFNQDLSGWCVTNFTTEPENFSDSTSPLTKAHKPDWGTCPE